MRDLTELGLYIEKLSDEVLVTLALSTGLHKQGSLRGHVVMYVM